MHTPKTSLTELLRLEEIKTCLYRFADTEAEAEQMYGGQALGQALLAASRTLVDDRLAHSLHAYFLRPGDTSLPVLYEVEKIRDGRSFTVRQVRAIQGGRDILYMNVSFHTKEEGLEHQIQMPSAPAPETLESTHEILRQQAKVAGWSEEVIAQYTSNQRVDVRPITPKNTFAPEKNPPRQECWMRSAEKLPDDEQAHQCALAYLSDFSLLDTSTYPHGIPWFSDGIQVTSLDHAMWFHRPFRADEWLFFLQDSPQASGARGFNRGLIFNAEGALIASTAQEALMRVSAKSDG